MSKPLTSVASVIEAFGGPTKMGEAFGIRPSAVSNWKAAGRFSERMHYRIKVEAEARGIEIDPAVFDVPAPEPEARAS